VEFAAPTTDITSSIFGRIRNKTAESGNAGESACATSLHLQFTKLGGAGIQPAELSATRCNLGSGAGGRSHRLFSP
jgi:hypothetical protein